MSDARHDRAARVFDDSGDSTGSRLRAREEWDGTGNQSHEDRKRRMENPRAGAIIVPRLKKATRNGMMCSPFMIATIQRLVVLTLLFCSIGLLVRGLFAPSSRSVESDKRRIARSRR